MSDRKINSHFSKVPFVFGRTINPTEFIGREREMFRLFSRIANGQSTALIGQTRIGKTSFLNYVLDESVRSKKFSNRIGSDHFRFLDAQTLHGVNSQAGFWDLVLSPVFAFLEASVSADVRRLIDTYEISKANKFGTFVLEQLFAQLNKTGSRLVLLLDEFDDFLSHPVLNNAEFYGGLRSLASRTGGLVLVLAVRKELEQLNQLTQQINPHGSPYFNVFTEIKLGAFSRKDMLELLDRAGDRFTRKDRDFVEVVSGRHPYLVQTAAAMLCEAHEEGKTNTERYEAAANALHQEAKKHFADTWHFWSNATRKVMTTIGLIQIPQLLENHQIPVQQIIDDMDDYVPELQSLRENGIVAEGENGQWHSTQGAFLWWLADELRRHIRNDSDFSAWLRSQEMDDIVKNQERRRMGGVVKKLSSILGKGATTLIETFAKGFGEGTGKALASGGAKI